MTRLGLYLCCLHDRGLGEALDKMLEWELTAAEVSAAGFVPTPHCDTVALLGDSKARDAFADEFAGRGIDLIALNANGNPLHPDPAIGPVHAEGLRNTIRLAGELGIDRVVTMTGLPGSDPDAAAPCWIVSPWDSGLLDVRDWQWEEVAIPFWREIEALARDAGVKVCLEPQPHMLAYTPATLRRFVEAVGGEALGANLDPSHLFWQGIDPRQAAEMLDGMVYHAIAKDTIMRESAVRAFGVLDDRSTRPAPDADAYPLGGDNVHTIPPPDAPWFFGPAGSGHDAQFWAEFVLAVRRAGHDRPICIEYADHERPPTESVPRAARTMREAIAILGETTNDGARGDERRA